MLEIPVHIAMQQGDMEQAAARLAAEAQSCILCHFGGRVGDAANHSYLPSVFPAAGGHVLRLTSAEYRNMGRRCRTKARAVQRIMVTVDQEHLNPVASKFLQGLPEPELPLKRSI